MTIPTGFVKSTIQASSRGELAHALGDLRASTGTVRIAFAKPPAPGRLLADAAAGERDRLVAQPRRLPADADLDEHEVRPLDRPVEVGR